MRTEPARCRLSVVIPAANRPPSLQRCVDAILAAREPPEQLIVVDDPAGGGAGGARNAGARQAHGEVLVFIDSDVVVHPDVFVRIRAAFDGDPELSAIFGSYDNERGAPGVVSAFRNLLHHHVHQIASGPMATFWAGLGAMRRSAFEEIGGFEPSNPIEDIELGMRLAAAGARLELDPELQGTHLKSWSLGEMVVTDFIIRGAPWVELMIRHDARPAKLNLAWSHRLSALACLTATGAAATRRPAVAGTSALTFVAINRAFYRLLLSRCSPAETVMGIGLHAVHHLVSVAAVPAGWVLYLSHERAPRLPAPHILVNVMPNAPAEQPADNLTFLPSVA